MLSDHIEDGWSVSYARVHGDLTTNLISPNRSLALPGFLAWLSLARVRQALVEVIVALSLAHCAVPWPCVRVAASPRRPYGTRGELGGCGEIREGVANRVTSGRRYKRSLSARLVFIMRFIALAVHHLSARHAAAAYGLVEPSFPD